MRIMTFNLRFENDRDGENSWAYRRELVVEIIARYRPHIVGTQEGRWSMLTYLAERLPGYVLHAPSRVIDDTCQYPTLFVSTEGLTVEDGGEFWLSKTPQMHRSLDWDSAFPRMMSWARVQDRRTGRRFWVSVTHLDHMGVEARRRQAEILAQWVRDRAGAHVVLGDFNDAPDSAVHRVLTDPGVGLSDTWVLLGRTDGPESHTHHGFTGVPQATRMDWILVSPHFRVQEAAIVRDSFQDRYPSDHFPYMADIHWASHA
ncbi:Metal-dependent hydrolase, endonuclease/exonuclease/phosphatase family [Desulfacinum hydrothermale DSM 13146]|uniref:Metal-dependent hydrolase, endonuclease/exonuclease/phosphatase family n=1 Tax=Desulfacinum hydrothermale DSM 13146 TaxID=1121390 RepID=A0A1W1XAI2_9BACT|nr:endonuclease/exonuclease/phosphatase family protein [Desulfacinum hydrothermale]SMC21035.1 Metal-dependent hydrolase, endonuclease/exonuclease/phosphatase family [Desulfacinum hydrothermale DSM 13146]